ncbi:polymer-forming cytoskeletal protein [Pelagibius litoralis]|uniref:Polymer-forming cytoskeletal protein n=1 Tax=Pelagibius litoralis TaxID=374515 RepID=A0A967C2D0_9PROT|nr:polymer-forming cytoskeletal protein [Pelagibius litoralis]NIA66984.1 polymer-forming cytoskeletal protein [Pelagibius litoralis]
MFSKTKETNGSPEAVTSTSTEPKRNTGSTSVPSIISADLKITGNLKSDGDIQVDGYVEGDIDSATLTVGEGAQVKGHISCDAVRICGTIDGAVKAKSVVMAKSARVIGDIIHDSLAIEAGAFIEGNIKRLEGASRPSSGSSTSNVSPVSTASTGSTAPAGKPLAS